MRAITFFREEALAIGFTHLFIVTHEDFTSEELAATEEVELTPLAVGDMVMNKVLLEVKTPAAGLTVATGVVAASLIAPFIPDVNLLAAGDPYYAAHADSGPFVALSADNLVFLLTGSEVEDEEEAPGEISAGEFWVWANISRKAQRIVQV